MKNKKISKDSPGTKGFETEKMQAGETSDAPESRTKEDAIEEMRRRFELIAQNTSDGIIVFKNWNIDFVSNSYLGQLGYPEEEEI